MDAILRIIVLRIIFVHHFYSYSILQKMHKKQVYIEIFSSTSGVKYWIIYAGNVSDFFRGSDRIIKNKSVIIMPPLQYNE
mgnify:FL=1